MYIYIYIYIYFDFSIIQNFFETDISLYNLVLFTVVYCYLFIYLFIYFIVCSFVSLFFFLHIDHNASLFMSVAIYIYAPAYVLKCRYFSYIVLLYLHFNISVIFVKITAQSTVVSSNFLVWKFRGKKQLRYKNYVKTVPFHKLSMPGNLVKLRYFMQCIMYYYLSVFYSYFFICWLIDTYLCIFALCRCKYV